MIRCDMKKEKRTDYNGFHKRSEEHQIQQEQHQHQEQHNRDFLNFFAEEQELLQNDETEAKLVEHLEENSPKHDTMDKSPMSASFRDSAQKHRRRNRRDHIVHDKLPFLVKQMSSRNMISSLREIDEKNKPESQNYRSSLKKENDYITQEKHQVKPQVPNYTTGISPTASSEGGSPRKNLYATTHDTHELIGSVYNQRGGGDNRSNAHHHHHRRRRAEEQAHRRNLTSTERFFEYLNTAPELGGQMGGLDDINLGHHSQLPIQSVSFSTSQENDKDDIDSSGSSQRDDLTENGEEDEEAPDVETPLLNRSRKKLKRYSMARFYGIIFSVLGIREIGRNIKQFLWGIALCIILPCLLVSTILFYFFQNPVILFFPKQVSVSWCFLFLVRQVLTLHLAKCTNYIVWVLTHRTKLSLRLLGPFVTLLLVQANGWPFLLTSWGCWNMSLLFGRQAFMKNWLFFLHIGMFTNTCQEDSNGHVLYASCNPDLGVLESDFYLRVLFSMITMGLTTALKRTAVALYLGRRMLQHYRPQLEALLYDMELIAEVAELAAETDKEGFDSFLTLELHEIATKKRAAQRAKLGFLERVPTFSPEGKHNSNNDSESSQDESKDDNEREHDKGSEEEDILCSATGMNYDTVMAAKDRASVTDMNRAMSSNSSTSGRLSSSISGNNKKVHWDQLKNMVKQEHSMIQDDGVDGWAIEQNATPDDVSSRLKRVREKRQTRMLEHSSWTGIEKTVSQLESWQEPVENHSKKDLPSIYDILQFQKAFSFIQNEYPFSSQFGPADTRKACVKSSIVVYKRLLKFAPPPSSSNAAIASPKSTLSQSSSTVSSTTSSSSVPSSGISNISSNNSNNILPFDVIGALAYNENGELIERRARALLRVFFPDKDHKLPEIAFVQSIDYVYKRLRFLRASLTNASKIDSVLEDMFNVLFYMIMLVLMISILGWNPWPLLVSFSTLIVSFAFAFGPSAAKYIEGILHIAVRRPYDIGDRITIEKAESIDPVVGPEIGNTWFVQDITLSTTTLRFATSGEVSTVNNYSICNSRIVNCARSLKPIVTVLIKFLLEKATHAKVDLFRSKVEVYLKDRPRAWGTEGIIHLRTNSVSIVDGYVEYKLRAQHVKSWQESAHILVQKGELSRYCAEVAKKLGIAYTNADGPNTQLDIHMKQD